MVLGVGVDYALFIVTRHRRNLRRGMSVRDSHRHRDQYLWASRAICRNHVCIAMLGLTALGVSFFYGMASRYRDRREPDRARIAHLAAGATWLPRPAVLRRKERRAVLAGNFVDVETAGFWPRWSLRGQAPGRARCGWRVSPSMALAIPFLALRLGHADQGNDPAGTTTRRGYDLIAEGFGPGYNSTLTLVVDGPQAQATAQTVGTALARVPERRHAQHLRSDGRVKPAAVAGVVQVAYRAAG